MQPINEKVEAFNAAKDLLSRNDDSLFRYIALELRRCLEAVVYEKLLIYRDWIPVDAARAWQPPQAFKALLRIETDAAQSATIGVALETKLGVPNLSSYRQLGVDHRPDPAWLTKTWNKLGSLVHANWPFARNNDQDNREKNRAFFEKTMPELEPYVQRSLSVTFSTVVRFECQVCGATVAASERGLESTGEATCLKCDSQFRAVKSGDDFTFFVNGHPYPCDECSSDIIPLPRELRIGYQFSCRNCGCKFEVAGNVWEIRRLDRIDIPAENS